MEFDGQLLYHFDQVFSHTSQPKTKDCLKIHHKSKVKFSTFSEREISKITLKWHSSSESTHCWNIVKGSQK